jgi:LacI family transcriptional regulator, galactose operon repressor
MPRKKVESGKLNKATLRDVARHAGVASSTISRYLNGGLHLPAQTRNRVRAAIAQLNYRPNVLARSLQSGRSHILGLIVPDLANPFFACVAEAAAAAAYRESYSILLCATGNDPEREAHYVNLLTGGQLDGLIYLGAHRRNLTLETIRRKELPVVIVDEEVEGVAGGRVFVENRRGGYLATAHLLHLGHRDIAFIGGEADLLTTVERRLGYEEALCERGLNPRPDRIILGEYTTQFGARATGELLTGSAPTAIFAASDVVAIGVLQTARQMGLNVPEDLSLVGFDDVPIAEMLAPPLTTVWQPAEDLGRAAILMLVRHLRDRVPLVPETLGVRLRIRGSTCRLKRGQPKNDQRDLGLGKSVHARKRAKKSFARRASSDEVSPFSNRSLLKHRHAKLKNSSHS